MNARRIGWLGLGGLTITLGGACQLVSGLSSLHETGSAGSTGGGGATSSGTTSSGTGGAGTTSSGGASSSAASSSTSSTGGAGGASDTCTAMGSQCLAVPSGWTAVAYDGPSTGPVSCPSGWVEQHRGGVSPQGVGMCSPCMCGAAACGKPTITLFTSTPDCTGTLTANFLEDPVVCDNNGGVATYSAKQSPIKAVCPPSGGVLSASTPMWATVDVTCTPLAPKTCGGGECVATPPTPLQLCVSRAGDVACPQPSLSTRQVFYTGVVDTSACSACSCISPVCTGNTTVYTGINCQGSLAATLTPNVCATNLAGVTPQSLKTALVASSACAPSGGGPTGAITADPTTAVTVCCP